MKLSLIAGIVIAALGMFVLLRGLNYGTQRSVMRIGDIQASVSESRPVPPWVGGVAIVGGLVLIGAGLRGRSRA